MDSEKDIPEYGALKVPKEQPHCEYCGMITWGDRCNCTQQPNMSRKIVAMFDMNADGRLTVEDLNIIAIRHEWMFVAGLFILVGSVGNVFGYWNIDSDLAFGMGYKIGSASATSTDYTSISPATFSRENIQFASDSKAFYSSDAIGGSANYMYRYFPAASVTNEDLFSPSQAAGTVINVAVFAGQDGGNSHNYTIGKSPSGFADSGYQSYITVTEIAP